MASEITIHPGVTVPTLPRQIAQHLRLTLASWGESNGLAEPLPNGVAEHLPTAIVSMKNRLKPASHEELAGLMARMWRSGVPCPDEATIAEWFRLLDGIPADVLAGAFDELAKSYQWPSPPKVADAMKFIRPEMGRRLAWMRKLETAALRAKLEAKTKPSTAPKLRDMPAAEREAFLAGVRERCPDGFRTVEAAMEAPSPQRGPCD